MMNTEKFCTFNIVTAVFLAVGFVVTSGCGKSKGSGRIVVGVYRAQEVLMAYPGVKELREKAQESVRDVEDDAEAMQRLQRRFYNEQKDLFEEYQHDLQKAIPRVARRKDLDMVVVEEAVQFRSENINEEDVTKVLIRAVREEAESGPGMGGRATGSQ